MYLRIEQRHRLGQFLLILFRVGNETDLKHFERIAKQAFQRISGIAQRARRKNHEHMAELGHVAARLGWTTSTKNRI